MSGVQRTLWVMLAWCIAAGMAQSQTVLHLKRADLQWPVISLRFAVDCGGLPSFDVVKRDLLLRENGREVHNFDVVCRDTTPRCPMSVALTFDVSGSMMGVGIDEARVAGKAFVEAMDGVKDEATVVAFSNIVRVVQTMTTSKGRLRVAIEGLVATGGTTMINGCYTALEELAAKGRNRCKAVVLLSDGADNGSWRTVQETIALANANAVKIYCVGLGTRLDTLQLKQLANGTGGRYFEVYDPQQLSEVYRVIAELATRDDPDCILRYTASCTDDTTRSIELVLRDYCGGSDSATVTVTVPGAAGRNRPLAFRMQDAAVWEGSVLSVPISVSDTLAAEMLPRGDLYIRYDPFLLGAPAARDSGTLLAQGTALVLDASNGRAHVRLLRDNICSGSGVLFALDFPTRDVSDTVCAPVFLERVSFDEGCIVPAALPGRVCVYPCTMHVRLDPEGEREICESDSLLLRADPGFARYEWFRDGVLLGDTSASIHARGAGEYRARVSDIHQCTAETGTLLLRTVSSAPRTAGNGDRQFLPDAMPRVLPFRLEPAYEAGRHFTARLRLLYDPRLLRAPRIDSSVERCWSGSMRVSGSPGLADVTLSGMMDGSDHPFLRFVLEAVPQKRVDSTSLTYTMDLSTGCDAALTLHHTPVLLDGYCESILQRAAPLSLRVFPNPATSMAELELSARDEGSVTVQISDSYGRVCLMLYDGPLAAGGTTLRADLGALPAGVYLVTASSSYHTAVTPLVLIR
ncbi:MAG: VWA domain-containing protein [Ignavibacteriae bacterium]|nr:VWA domain-containing protein [Ignavibacteriota bacterium]